MHRKILPASTYKQFSDDVVAHHSQTTEEVVWERRRGAGAVSAAPGLAGT